jgi:hypothetical protein
MLQKSYFILGLLMPFICQIGLAQQKLDSLMPQPSKGIDHVGKVVFSSDHGLMWENRITNSSSISLFTGISFGRQSDDYKVHGNAVIASPDFYFEYRNYYNFLRRLEKRKKTKNNAGEFLFGRLEAVLGVRGQNSFNLLACEGWGIQRTIGKRTLVGLQPGIIEHFFFDKPVTGGFNNVKLEPMLSFSVCIAIDIKHHK